MTKTRRLLSDFQYTVARTKSLRHAQGTISWSVLGRDRNRSKKCLSKSFSTGCEVTRPKYNTRKANSYLVGVVRTCGSVPITTQTQIYYVVDITVYHIHTCIYIECVFANLYDLFKKLRAGPVEQTFYRVPARMPLV
jgi:hypothetical protein